MSKRLSIPDSIKLKLWVLSGGRCEFPGCNEYVWRDGLTLNEDNFAHMAHIVAASTKGPRGDENLSPKLSIEFENLMLVCLKCSKLIDGKNKTAYSINDLQKYKQAHEDRIRIQTDLQPESKTTVVRFMANIGDRAVKIGLNDTYQAILPRFPADERGLLMDFTNRPGRGEANYWESFANEIVLATEQELRPGNNRQRPDHISIFALGPIPLLIKLGHSIGNTISADLFQRHRDTEDWKWKDEIEERFEYHLQEDVSADSGDVAIVLSLSGKIHRDEVYKNFKVRPSVYEISVDSPNPAFLDQKSKLQKFRNMYRDLVSLIRDRHGGGAVIHLFPAIPAPIAVLCGRELLPKSDPSMIVYDHEKEQGGFIQILKIN
jgi:SMODS-associated and fused to various effectors sensor domain